MSAEYGTVNTQDEETPLVSREIGEEHLTIRQKVHRFLRQHHIHIARGWLIVIAITVVLTLSFHFALRDKAPHVPEDPQEPQEGDLIMDDMCVSERSWFVALMLSIFLGPFGVDRFYLGYIFIGIIKLLTAGLGGILWTIDIVLIALNVLNDHPNGCHLH